VVGVGGASIWGRRAGEGSRLQSASAALVLLAIAGLFGLMYWSRAKDAGGTFVGTPIKRYLLGEDRVALIMKRTVTNRVRDVGETGTSDDTSVAWELVIRELGTGVEVKRVELMERGGGSLATPWLRDAGEGRLWVYDGLRVSRVDLRTGEITREAAREGALLRPEFVFDATRRCIVEVEAGPLAFERASLAHKQATRLALSRAADGEVAWSEELETLCGSSGALRGAYQVGWGAVFVFESGASCGVGADGRARWRRGQREVFDLGEVKEARLFEAAVDGGKLELWGASSSGRQLYRAVVAVEDGAVSIKQTL